MSTGGTPGAKILADGEPTVSLSHLLSPTYDFMLARGHAAQQWSMLVVRACRLGHLPETGSVPEDSKYPKWPSSL